MNLMCFSQRIVPSSYYPGCGQDVETTVLHVIRDCFISHRVWKVVFLRINENEFFNFNIWEWLMQNITRKDKMPIGLD